LKRSAVFTGITAAAAAAALAVGPAAAAPKAPSVSDPIVSGLAGPLQMEVNKGGILVGQSFAGLLSKVGFDGSTRTLVTEDAEIAGVASRGRTIAYTYSRYAPEEEGGAILAAQLKIRKPNGRTKVLADLLRFEQKRNPDGIRTYGFKGLSDSCAEQVPAEVGGEPYTGILDSHPYAVAKAPHGGWYVADAAGNDILKVTRHGKIKVVYVTQPQHLVVTEEIASNLGLPDCVVGKSYRFEGVPTDVEVTRSGHLVVSLLPGGPEDPSLGARGSVIKVNPWKGTARVLARGLAAATNVAVSPSGKVYAAELFGGQVSVIRNGRATPYVSLPEPAALEYHKGKLYVATNVFSDGSIVKVRAH
jgi:hypothetical protein